MRIVQDIIERRIFRFVVAYCAASWAALELVDQLVGNDLLPAYMYRGILALVACGLPGALIVSWFHGAKGRQEVPRIERWLLAGVAVFALGTTGFVVNANMEPPDGTAELAATQDPTRVAVLYMDARGGGDADFLASGLTEALIDQLGAVDGLTVISRNGAQLFRGVTAAPDSIGRALQVGSLVSGTVALAGDRVRVDIALTSSAGRQLRSHRLERPRAEIFALQDELADTVTVFLRRAIGRELGELTLRTGTRSTRAWELVSQAQQATDAAQLSAADVDAASRSLSHADALLQQAEAADPQWAEPVIRRGWVAYRQSRLGGMDRAHNEKWIGEGLSHAERALAMAPNSPAALELRATLIYWRYLLNLAGSPEESERLFQEAEQGFRNAIRAAGGRLASAQNSLSHLLMNRAQASDAKLNALEAYRADPFLENAHLTIWRIFLTSWNLEDTVEAPRYCAEGLRRYPDDFRFQQCRLMVQSMPGIRPDVQTAWEALESFTATSPPQVRELNRRRGLMYVAMALARAAQETPERQAQLADSARALLLSARAGADVDPLRDLAQLETIARTKLGDIDEAVRQLSMYFSANPQSLEGMRGDVSARRELPWYYRDLLNEPAFRSLLGLR